jgi:hypothetical protein
MNLKSERLKKLENELLDLEQWLKLDLVPKKDLANHREEMRQKQKQIEEEKERLRFLKESGEIEEFTSARRPIRQPFQEPQSLPDMDVVEEGLTDAGFDMETESFETETATGEEGEEETNEDLPLVEEEEDPFSDRNRWRRGVLEDPDARDW